MSHAFAYIAVEINKIISHFISKTTNFQVNVGYYGLANH